MLFLASRSPRRRQLLAQIGFAFEVLAIDVPEQRAAGESPAEYVARVAGDKARAGRAQRGNGEAWVLAADTEVVLDDEVFGKPADADDAHAMLRRLSGREHEVISAVCLLGPQAQAEARAQVVTRVRFASLTDADIARYVASGEPFGKAGGYAIQGRGAVLVQHLEGSWSGVVGLPLFETAGLLHAAGLSPTPA